jgi:hypothetical protein
MSNAPIDRCTVVPVPGKPYTFILVEKDGQVFSPVDVIEAAFNAGQMKKG